MGLGSPARGKGVQPMRVVYHWTRLPEGKIVEVVQEGREFFVLMDELADPRALAWEMSLLATRLLNEAFVYIGPALAEPAA